MTAFTFSEIHTQDIGMISYIMAKFEYSESKYNELIDPQHASYDAIKTWEDEQSG